MRVVALFFFLVIELLFSVTAHSQKILWEKSLGGKQSEYLMDALPTPDYGFILAGSSFSDKSGNKTESSRGDLDYCLWKLNEKGELEWQKSFGGANNDLLQSVALTKDGGFILAGVSSSNKGFDKSDDSFGQTDFWVVKLNAKGTLEWQVTLGGEGQEKLHSVKPTNDGGFILGGTSSSKKSETKKSNNHGGLDIWIVKLDSKGKLVWENSYGGRYTDELRCIDSTYDNGFILGSYSNSSIGGTKKNEKFGEGDFWVIKIDNIGNEIWQKSFGGIGDDQLTVIHQSKDKGFIVGGNSSSEKSGTKSSMNQSGTDYWIIKLDENGDELWQRTYNYGKTDVLTSIIENEDESFIVGGYAKGEFSSNTLTSFARKEPTAKKGTDDFIITKLDKNGEEIWTQTIGSKGEDILKKAFETRDGGYILAGTSNSKPSGDKQSNQGSNDFWIVKLKDPIKPEKTKLSIEAFPNPTTTMTNVIVGYDFKKGSVTVVDLSGRQLQKFDISSRTIPIDFTGLPEGLYIVSVKTDVQTDSVKIIKSNNQN